jgi:ribonucleoside-diphosphate reductase alpha chain
MNIHLENPNNAMLTAMHFHAWEKGLKTGTYYLRSKAATRASQVTIEQNVDKKDDEKDANLPISPVQQAPPQTLHTPAKVTEGVILDSFTSTAISGPTCTMDEGCVSCSG